MAGQSLRCERFGVGVNGASPLNPGGLLHIPAIRALPDYELRAVSTSRAESARAAADRSSSEGQLTLEPLFCMLAAQNEASRICLGDLLAVLIGHRTFDVAYVFPSVHDTCFCA